MTTIILRLFRKRIPNIHCVTQITVMRHRKFLLASSCDCEIPTHYRGNQRELDLTNHMHGFSLGQFVIQVPKQDSHQISPPLYLITVPRRMGNTVRLTHSGETCVEINRVPDLRCDLAQGRLGPIVVENRPYFTVPRDAMIV